MKRVKFLMKVIAAVAGFCLTACGGADQTSSEPSKVNQVKPLPKPVQPLTQDVSLEGTLLKRGKIVWFKCRSCHETSVDGPNKVGPNLYGIMDAEAGIQEGFVYSAALANSGIIWTEEALDAFIEKPSNYIKGTKMAFVGIKKESDRDAVIAYIKENTKSAE